MDVDGIFILLLLRAISGTTSDRDSLEYDYLGR